jgi:hypothetical protein
MAQLAWGWATTLLYQLRDPRHIQGNTKKLNIMHAFPTKKTSKKLHDLHSNLDPARGVSTVWSICIEQNEKALKTSACSNLKLGCMIMDNIINCLWNLLFWGASIVSFVFE